MRRHRAARRAARRAAAAAVVQMLGGTTALAALYAVYVAVLLQVASLLSAILTRLQAQRSSDTREHSAATRTQR